MVLDASDAAWRERHPAWSQAEVRRFMIVFGLIGSAFDLQAFALLRHGFEADAALLHSGWFVLSLLAERGVRLLLRAHAMAWHNRASPLLPSTTVALAVLALLLAPTGYALATEAAKRRFFGGARQHARRNLQRD